MGSNPTPRASNEGFNANIIRKESKLASSKKKVNLTYQTPQTTQGSKDYDKMTVEKTIDKITTSLSKPYFNKILKQLTRTNSENAMIICNYILTEQTEINIKNSTKEGKIKVLVWLSNYFDDRVSFKELKKVDILDYLNSLRKSYDEDPRQKWIGSYNNRQMILTKFFKWLYNQDEADTRKRLTPPCIQGIRGLPSKEKTAYKPSDIWDSREHAIFLRYCPSKRDRCYHSMANDMSARPHEILNLRISDIEFHISEEGKSYAEARITGGKTGSRTVPLIDSLPYLREWLQEHPSSSNKKTWLFVSRGNNHGCKLTYDGLVKRYEYYKKKYFPSLINHEAVPAPDKSFIRNLLTKPWNLYVFRHSTLTEKSQYLTESILRSHAGWTMSSKMPQVYIHLSGESSKILLEKRGIISKQDKEKLEELRSRQCPNCSEPNRRDARFCFKCKMLLVYDEYISTLEKQKEKENELKVIKERMIAIEEGQKELLELLKHPRELLSLLNSE